MSYQFFKMAAGSHIEFYMGNITPHVAQFCIAAWSTNLESIGFVVS